MHLRSLGHKQGQFCWDKLNNKKRVDSYHTYPHLRSLGLLINFARDFPAKLPQENVEGKYQSWRVAGSFTRFELTLESTHLRSLGQGDQVC